MHRSISPIFLIPFFSSVALADPPANAPVSFANEVVPIFTKLGCNTGTCHGKTGGQNGFGLSLFGFEPAEDYDFLVKEARGRRLFPAAAESSLLLMKATGKMAHGGGKRLDPNSPQYELLKRWIAQGTPYRAPNERAVVRIEVEPRDRVLQRGARQQLKVIAHHEDGSTTDVTWLAQFEVNDVELAEVSPNGLVSIHKLAGSVAVMTRYQTHVDVFRALVPLGVKVSNLPSPANFIDEHVYRKLLALGMPPSPIADDATLLRRVTIDIAGRLPTLEETTAYLANKDAHRYEQTVDRLLSGPDYAYYFAGKWGAVLRNRRKSDKDDAHITLEFHKWIKESLQENKPFDQFVREILTVIGPHTEKPTVAWFREVNKVHEQVEDVAQLFLGQRIGCARCHHHPFEKWSQQDYYGMAAFFSRVEVKDPPAPKKQKDMKVAPPKPPISVAHSPGLAEALNPRTGKMVRPAGLGAVTLELAPEVDPRAALVDWLTGPNNPYFARALVNRYWKHFLGRGLVEPEDDLRVTNPATNAELLDALANSFRDSKYDLKKLVRTICLSNTYRLSAQPNEHNAQDRQHYARFQPRHLNAEVFLDAIDDLAQARSTFKGVPAGTRAVQLPDNQVDSYFLSVFGRPDFSSACECERSGDANLAQSLHLVNSKDLLAKIGKGRAGKLAKDKRPHAERVRELYLTAFSRQPSAEETSKIVAYIERRGDALTAYEDVIWSIINTKEFMFNH